MKLCCLITDKEPSGQNLRWLARYLRSSGLSPMWSTLRNVLKRVVARHLDTEEARPIQIKLDAITDCCTCPNDQVRINQMVKTLEDESIGTHDAFNWFIEVLEDPAVNRGDLVPEIRRKLHPAPGPVY